MKKYAACFPVIVVLVLGIISWIILSDVVVVQVGLNGQVFNRIPKAFAILLSIIITIAGSVIIYSKSDSKSKGLILSIVGIVIMILTLIFNL